MKGVETFKTFFNNIKKFIISPIKGFDAIKRTSFFEDFKYFIFLLIINSVLTSLTFLHLKKHFYFTRS